jgi:hypothetical protein
MPPIQAQADSPRVGDRTNIGIGGPWWIYTLAQTDDLPRASEIGENEDECARTSSSMRNMV